MRLDPNSPAKRSQRAKPRITDSSPRPPATRGARSYLEMKSPHRGKNKLARRRANPRDQYLPKGAESLGCCGCCCCCATPRGPANRYAAGPNAIYPRATAEPSTTPECCDVAPVCTCGCCCCCYTASFETRGSGSSFEACYMFQVICYSLMRV